MDDQSSSVLVQVDHSIYGSARCCGLQFDNVIIVYGDLLISLYQDSNYGNNKEDAGSKLKNFDLVMTELSKLQYFVNPENYHKGNVTFSFRVVRKNLSGLSRPIRKSNDDSYSGFCDSKRSVSKDFISEDARLCLVYKFEHGIVNDIFNLGHHIESLSETYDSFALSDIPVLLFLMTGIPTKHSFKKSVSTLLSVLRKATICPGLAIAVESTPFTNLAFYNSLSQGIISKSFGPDQEAFMIDARLTFGCEGAPIYIFENGVKGAIIGIVFCLLGTSTGESIGFSLGLSLKYLLEGVLQFKTNDYSPVKKLTLYSNPHFGVNIERVLSAVIYVRCQHASGSGVVVDTDLGLVLTCSHIVYHAQDSVYVVFSGKIYPADVVYASPPSDPYDLALLSVGRIPGLTSLIMAERSPVVGESVVTVGYVLPTESMVVANGSTVLSGGCVSKVCTRGGPLQTTCCTQPGVSGGAVLRPPDQLIGIVVSNICINTSVMLPFFGIAVSVDDFRTSIVQYINTRDPICLQSLSVTTPEVKLKWMLQDSKL